MAKAVLRGSPQLLAQGCASSGPQHGDSEPIRLSESSVEIMRRELQLRFARSVDWSQIS